MKTNFKYLKNVYYKRYNTKMNNTNKIFRFKLADETMSLITQFAKIHQNDDRHTYKAAWQGWLMEQRGLLETEVLRLKALGYTGDVEDKMFKAGRYYFRSKKAEEEEKEKEKKEKKGVTKKKREYIIMNHQIIQAMDEQLQNIINDTKFTPADGYRIFCENNINILRTEIIRLTQNKTITAEKMSEKFKKTYKNRYFSLVKVHC